MDNFLFALRRVRGAPASSLFVVSLLALVFVLAASIFTVANGLLWAPLPYPDQERLVNLSLRSVKMDMALGWSRPFLHKVEGETETLEMAAAYLTKETSVTDVSGQRIGTIDNVQAQPDLFKILLSGVLRGRVLNDADAAAGAEPVVVVSEDFWRSHLGADDGVLERFVLVGSTRHRVVGVMPRSFAFPSNTTQLWLPLGFTPEEVAEANAGSFGSLRAIGKMASGHTLEQVTAELLRITRGSPALKSIADSIDLQPEAKPLRNIWLEGRGESTIKLLGAALLVFIVTQFNAYTLFLLRVVRRRKEFATLESVGASPIQIRVQVAIEAAILCLAAALLAACLLPSAITLLGVLDILPTGLPYSVGFDSTSVAALAVMSFIFLAVFASATFATRGGELYDSLRQSAHGHVNRGAGSGLRKALVVGQIALTLILLSGTGLLVRSSEKVLEEETGYARQNRLIGSLKIQGPLDDVTEEQAQAMYRAWIARTAAFPGATAVSLSSAAPLSKSAILQTYTTGTSAAAGSEPPQSHQFYVGEDYFRALELPIVRGRAFSRTETSTIAPVVIIDEAIAAKHFAGEDSIGKSFTTMDSRTEQNVRATIVGVARQARQRGVAEEDGYPSIYLPDDTPVARAGLPGATAEFVVKATDPLALQEHLEAHARLGAPEMDVQWSQTIESRIADSIADQLRLNLLLKILSGFAIVLSGAGLYALLANSVQARRSELGIRLALGATPWVILVSVLRQGALIVGAGLVLGLPLALWLGRKLEPNLHELSGSDPMTLLSALATVGCIGLIANLFPAFMASRADPAETLRSD